MSLAEVLVAVAIVGVLLVVAIPAVQSARERSRQVTCRNNLKQIGIAFEYRLGEGGDAIHPSDCVRELDRTLHSLGEGDLSGMGRPTSVGAIWQCPADSRLDAELGHFSYLPNVGEGAWGPDSGAVIASESVGREMRKVWPDGQSQTVRMSERLIGPVSISFPRHQLASQLLAEYPLIRLTYYLPVSLRQPISRADAVAGCQTREGGIEPVAEAEARYGATLHSLAAGYHHILPPNQSACMGGASDPRILVPPGSFYVTAMVSATSDHPGVVTVLMADGAVRLISESVGLHIWEAIGTAEASDVGGDF